MTDDGDNELTVAKEDHPSHYVLSMEETEKLIQRNRQLSGLDRSAVSKKRRKILSPLPAPHPLPRHRASHYHRSESEPDRAGKKSLRRGNGPNSPLKRGEKNDRRSLGNLDLHALTSQGVIKTYQIDDDTITHNPMGGIDFGVQINHDRNLIVSFNLNRPLIDDEYGELEDDGGQISEKLDNLLRARYGNQIDNGDWADTYRTTHSREFVSKHAF